MIFVLNRVRVCGAGPHLPTQGYIEYPPPPRPHMTPSARDICTRAVFATSSFNFGLPTYFVSHCCYGRGVFQKKESRAV